MRGKVRPEPVIPDHEVLRKIGGGSYGEVWLARGVTGAMRAVKLVRREDFEDEVGFEREFEGILKYEPISRDHPALVNILHVGRSADSDEGVFYYYVMELGDDVHPGDDINPVEYEPRNLRTDLKKANGIPMEPDTVITVGLRLAEALAYLHDKGLAHRDIKPSNIIFVGGKAKLADIGLVAARGQRTFVGTEGFVPPEGPGSARADIYGLGKVLYEMASGRDRMEFPELPDELPAETNRKRWLALNQLICDVCEPRAAKRSIDTAAGLAAGLGRLQRGQKVRSGKRGVMSMLILPLLAAALVLAWVSRDSAWWPGNNTKTKSPNTAQQYGSIKVISDPEGVEVYDHEGNFLDITPLKNIEMPAGSHYEFEFKMRGYRTERVEGKVIANKTTLVEKIMAIYAPPVQGEEWGDNFGIIYQPMDDYHISSGFVRWYQWQRFVKDTGKNHPAEFVDHSESGVNRRIALVAPAAALDYCDWQSEKAIKEGYLNEFHQIIPRVETNYQNPKMSENASRQKWSPFRTMVKEIAYARLDVDSDPEGADVQIDGEHKGLTPLSLDRVKPGSVELILSLDGYRRHIRTLSIKDRADEKLRVALHRNNSVVFGEKWNNSLGMQFVPIGEDLLVSAWETRVRDYRVFTKETNSAKRANPDFKQGPDHPVISVSREDAMAFCGWLTERERKLERISEEEAYRLLTDLEWSKVAGLDEDPDAKPSTRELRVEKAFPWGRVWPPEDAGILVGNLADKTASQAADLRRDRTLLDYEDGYEKTSPVGSFLPNSLGVYDLAGNASEWVSDDYAEDGLFGVLRGGSWSSYLAKDLYITSRNAVRPTKTGDHYGFRIALAKNKEMMRSESPQEETSSNDEP